MMQYPVMEHFYTLQGEGRHAGSAAYFIRLGGCSVGCVWCDVKESWDAEKHPSHTTDEIVTWVRDACSPVAVITGGEPCMYDLRPLIEALHVHGIKVWIETSGAYPLQGKPDWVCLSPKKFKAPLPEMLRLADEFKVVVFHKSDIHWAQAFLPELKASCIWYLQPEWDKKSEMLPLIIGYIKENPKWTLSLQTHKYIDIP